MKKRIENMIYWILISVLIVSAVIAFMFGMIDVQTHREYLIINGGVLEVINQGGA